MPVEWLEVPYEEVEEGGRVYRRVPVDQYTAAIDAADGYWSEVELDGDRALVRVRAPQPLLRSIENDTGWRQVDPANVYRKSRKHPDGHDIPTRQLQDLIEDVLTDPQLIAVKARVEALMRQADRDGYVRLNEPWRHAARLLAMLGRHGYGLDRVSTGTFPTTGVLDAFTGTNGTTPPNANWTNNRSGTGDGLEIQSNGAVSNDAGAGFENAYFNVADYGPDCEAYATIAALSTGAGQAISVMARLNDEGTATFDLYQVSVTTVGGADNDTWQIYRALNGSFTQQGATITQEIAAGEKVGFECLGDQHSAYRFSGSWSLVGTRTEATITAAEKIGLELKGESINPASIRADDFGGDTIATATGPPPGSLSLMGVGR